MSRKSLFHWSRRTEFERAISRNASMNDAMRNDLVHYVICRRPHYSIGARADVVVRLVCLFLTNCGFTLLECSFADQPCGPGRDLPSEANTLPSCNRSSRSSADSVVCCSTRYGVQERCVFLFVRMCLFMTFRIMGAQTSHSELLRYYVLVTKPRVRYWRGDCLIDRV